MQREKFGLEACLYMYVLVAARKGLARLNSN